MAGDGCAMVPISVTAKPDCTQILNRREGEHGNREVGREASSLRPENFDNLVSVRAIRDEIRIVIRYLYLHIYTRRAHKRIILISHIA